jgi:uncharacterized membrane protein affecting hemolysin expression
MLAIVARDGQEIELMKTFRKASIQHKQMWIIMLTCGTALLWACASFVGYELIIFRKEMVRQLASLAEIIGKNSTAALEFRDEGMAKQTLAALRTEPNVEAAGIYDQNGRIFATYRRGNSPSDFEPLDSQAAGHEFKENHLFLVQPMLSNGKHIGVVYVKADLQALYDRLRQFAIIALTVLLGSSLVALLLSNRLQRLISGPILHLAKTTRTVALEKKATTNWEN